MFPLAINTAAKKTGFSAKGKLAWIQLGTKTIDRNSPLSAVFSVNSDDFLDVFVR
jgi:hypothetical protein